MFAKLKTSVNRMMKNFIYNNGEFPPVTSRYYSPRREFRATMAFA